MSPPTPMSPPPSPIFAIKSSRKAFDEYDGPVHSSSRAVDENDGPLHFNVQPLSETGDFDSAVSELHFVRRKLF